MSQANSDAVDAIVQAVVQAVDQKIGDANFDKSQTGTVVAVDGDKYTIAVFGSQYTITSDQVFTVGQSVVVTALQGDMKRLVCSPDNVGTMKTVDSKVNVVSDKVDNFIGADFADTVIRFNDIKDQIDGSYIIWFENEEPTLENSPAKDWTTDDAKKVHIGDLYYNKVDGTAYKWTESYTWEQITDKNVIKVFAAASQDSDAIDGKRRIFYATPTTPYDKGDVWARAGDDGFMLICQIGRTIEDSYSRPDWVVASKYTDDTVADRAEDKADEANKNLESFKTEYDSDFKVTKEAIEARVTKTDYQEGINGVNTRLNQAESTIKQNAENIELKVSSNDYNGNKIASLINQQADNISISASKINLRGAVTADSIAASGISGDSIKAGKISAKYLDISGDLSIAGDGKVTIGNNVISADMLMPNTISERLWRLIDHLDTDGSLSSMRNYAFPEQNLELSGVTSDMYSFFVIIYEGCTQGNNSGGVSQLHYGTLIIPCRNIASIDTAIKDMCPKLADNSTFILGYRSITT